MCVRVLCVCMLVSVISHASPAWKLQSRVMYEPLLLTKTERAASANIWHGVEDRNAYLQTPCKVISSAGRTFVP